jgi:hypothetical protein
MGKTLIVWLFLFSLVSEAYAGEPDVAFSQPVSHKYALPPEVRGEAKRICIDKDDIVYILTSKGVYRIFGDTVARDRSYRPLADKIPNDITVANGNLYYLFPDEITCNRNAGKFVRKLSKRYDRIAVNEREEILLWSGRDLALIDKEGIHNLSLTGDQPILNICSFGKNLYAVMQGKAVQIGENEKMEIIDLPQANGPFISIGFPYGTAEGLGDHNTIYSRVPSTNVTALKLFGADLWVGTTRGVWKKSSRTGISYFASKRWLDDDHVIDLAVDSLGNAWALTATGLNEIEFINMTLAQKAAWYEDKIRKRHIRYGFCAELHLKEPGVASSAEMVDTDNDGTWSNYYMASQAFHYGATGDEKARSHAWETFTALERLESINPLNGFPARTFERTGYKISDPERWHSLGDGIWDWKSHTSSDEIIAHTFGSAVMYEAVAQSSHEKARITKFVTKVVDHIIRNNWYLIDVDGKPTLWGRWNPEYVNHFPITVFDRRLNSSEIIALLQFAYHISGNESYKTKAYKLLEKHGYLENIMSPMAKIGQTDGIVHLGVEMGDDWNHSDDLLAFVCYYVLHKYAFTDDLRAKYAEAIQDHWQFEKIEKCPLWNFIYASTGARDFDFDGALWTLRGFPLDMVDWTITNSHRNDITRKQPNFRNQQLEELLPPCERRITRWNAQPFVLDGGSGGTTELAGDEFLLPYWMGRYLKLISK